MVSVLIGFLLTLYMAYVAINYLDDFEAHLKRSKLVISNRLLMGDSMTGKTYRLLQISSCLSLRSFFIRKGQLDPDDSSEFPQYLARKVVWPNRLILIFGFIVLLGGGYGEYFNGYKL